MAESKRIALLGQPNSGKSTIFNTLTGLHQHVGNWPGKTVEKKEGDFVFHDVTYTIADLPGSYSLTANSDEEIVTRDYIAKEDLDLVCILVDASQVERSMYMLADFVGIKTPAMIVFSMLDVAKSQGKKIDFDLLSKRLGVEVCGLVAHDKKGYAEFYEKIEKSIQNQNVISQKSMVEAMEHGEKAELYRNYEKLATAISSERRPAEWIAFKMLENDEAIIQELKEKGVEDIHPNPEGALYTSDVKFTWIADVIKDVVIKNKKSGAVFTKFDRIAVGPKTGIFVAYLSMFVALMGAMVVSAPFLWFGGKLPEWVNPIVDQLLGSIGVPSLVIHFLKSTIVTALGWVMTLVGYIFAMSFIFGILEEVGYMARISYVFDRSMRKLGLQGKAIMPIIMGFGCTVGSASGARVIDSQGQRILTIAVAWAVPCGATFAVIPALANAFFGFGGAILVMLLIFAIMIVHIIVTAKVFGRRLNPVDERVGIIMELPPFHKPRWGFIIKNAIMRMWEAFEKAFIVEIIVCAVFYVLSYSPTGIEGSLLYAIGSFIAPVTHWFGLTWQTFMAFFAAMLSKEAVLGVLSAIYANSGSVVDTATGLAATSDQVSQLVAASISKAEALAFLVAVTFNMPCIQAVIATYHETHSAKWTAKIGIYYILTALGLACIIYNVAGLFM